MGGASAQLAYMAEVSHGKAKQGGAPIGVAVDGIGVLKGNGLSRRHAAGAAKADG